MVQVEEYDAWDEMISLYEKYGYYKEGLETMTLKGMDGAEKIQSMMNEMRNNPPKQLEVGRCLHSAITEGYKN